MGRPLHISRHDILRYDCGVFMCKTADYLSQEAHLDFTQADMQYFRRRLVVEIRNSALLDS